MRLPLTQRRLQELFDYDGHALIWRNRQPSDFPSHRHWKRWNTCFAGKVAGWLAGDYPKVAIDNRAYLSHRLIFLREYGYLPEHIDHINGVTTDNRLENLRPADKSINGRNTKLPKDNTSGRIGVSWYKARNKWQVQIGFQNRRIPLGTFETFEAACAARAAAEIKYNFHPNHGRVNGP